MLGIVDTPVGVGCGSYRLDMALTEAFPLGYMHEIFAQNGVGKTTLALEILGQHQKAGGLVGYLDVEGSLNQSLVKSIQTLDMDKVDDKGNPLWIYKEGIVRDLEDEDDERVLSGEECLQYAEIFLSNFKNSILVIDSIDSLVPEAILYGKDIGDNTIGKLAKLMSDVCRRFKGIVKKNNNALIWINQVRENPGKMFGDPEVTPGGKAVGFYSCQRVKLSKGEAKANFVIDDTGNILGHLVKVKPVKNKLPTTNYEPYFWIKYGRGIDRARELAELALELGIVDQEKTSYFFNRGTDEEKKIVGREKTLSYIHANPSVMEWLEGEVTAMVGK
jgi:recombination protein RecA